ncbi:hypothetical protein BAE44_0011855 [Dichanthelium oligosanthes]|uniref:Retrovirus-related Pol polyprotein from transposon TNT 1-94-like beta-barrel domain-containing protein n=1 Tax=Dichanthelium oligosanthes TaxID=888268 RepID=A0A1E5VPQ9_9POAL|nr:hypothetical protein BAE44_0011855 [Dichanthelium oligosanthes]
MHSSSGSTTMASWVVSTACIHHMTGNRSLISNLKPVNGRVVYMANGSPMQVGGCGDVITETLVLPDVWYVPGLEFNLVSAGQLRELDIGISFIENACCIKKYRDKSVVGKAHVSGGIYVVDFVKVPLNETNCLNAFEWYC